MKKSLLLAAASLFAVSAMAVNQDTPKAIFNAADVQLSDVKVVKPQIKKDAVKFKATSGNKNFLNSKIRVASVGKAASGVSAEGEALFGIPEGSFFTGNSNTGSYLPGGVLSPAYTDIVWPNMTSDWATTFSWEYGAEESGLVESPEYGYSSERDLALSLGAIDLRISPKLTASNGTNSDIYYLADETRKQMGVEQGQDIGAGYHFIGGGFSSLWSQLFQGDYGISPCDPDHGMVLYTVGEEGTYLMGTGMPYTMLINMFSAPASPYGIGPDGIWIQGMFGASEDVNTEITLTIYKAERTEVKLESTDGTTMNFPGVELGDKIASCTKTLGDFKDYMELYQGAYYGALTFDTFVAEDEFGYEADVTPIIDSEIAIVITGFDKLSKFALYTNEQAATEAELPLYPTMAFWSVENWKGLGAALYENMSMVASIDANFSFIKTASNSVTVPVNGGTADLVVDDTYLTPGAWSCIGMFGASEDVNTEITLTIYKAERTEVKLESTDGTTMNFPGVELGDKIASCTKTLGDFKDYMELYQGAYYGALTFDTFVAEDEFGYEADVTPIIDSEIAIVITGFDKLSKFALYTNEQAATEAELPLYPTMAFWSVENWKGLGAALYENMSMVASIDANFSFIKTASNSVTVPVNGGTADLVVDDTYLTPGAWSCIVNGSTVEFDQATAAAELADWLTVYLMQYSDQTTGEVSGYGLQFEADALPSGTAGRSLQFTLTDIYGGSADLTVQQGEAGVEAVETSANRVSVVNGNFEVEAASATSVDVYNVAGQKVASAAIEGTTVVPAQDLAKGLYILKFNDNTAVKVMK